MQTYESAWPQHLVRGKVGTKSKHLSDLQDIRNVRPRGGICLSYQWLSKKPTRGVVFVQATIGFQRKPTRSPFGAWEGGHPSVAPTTTYVRAVGVNAPPLRSDYREISQWGLRYCCLSFGQEAALIGAPMSWLAMKCGLGELPRVGFH